MCTSVFVSRSVNTCVHTCKHKCVYVNTDTNSPMKINTNTIFRNQNEKVSETRQKFPSQQFWTSLSWQYSLLCWGAFEHWKQVSLYSGSGVIFLSISVHCPSLGADLASHTSLSSQDIQGHRSMDKDWVSNSSDLRLTLASSCLFYRCRKSLGKKLRYVACFCHLCGTHRVEMAFSHGQIIRKKIKSKVWWQRKSL